MDVEFLLDDEDNKKNNGGTKISDYKDSGVVEELKCLTMKIIVEELR